MKENNNCLTWIMAMWDLICHYVTSFKYLRVVGNKSTISSFPDELIIDILSRVPAQSVLACRAVCSTWRRLFNTTEFNDMHLIRSTPVILGLALDNYYPNRGGWFVIDNFKFTNVKVTGVEFSRQAYGSFNGSNPRAQAVCDGLIILRNSSDSYVICNPITREDVAFRLRSCDEICGFYFHRVDKEYTLLICDKNDKNKYSVYGLSSKDRRRLATSANFNLDTYGVAICGALFWRTSNCNNHNSLTVNTESILMFNLDSENFAVKDQPTDRYKRERRTQVKLLEIDEKLGFCDAYLKSVQVWILEDVETWQWCKRYVVDLRGFINNGNGDMPDAKTRVVATQNGNMLLFRSYYGLVWYNLRLNKFRRINTDTLDMKLRDCFRVCEPDCVSFTRSLVSLRKCNILPESPISSLTNEVIIWSTISRLPDEVIINILSRVPAESVLAFRAVCSAWHRMTNTTQFTEMHLIRSTPVIFGRALNKYDSYSWFSIDNFRFRQLKMTGVGFLRQASKARIQAVCDGLIIFRSSMDSYYVICNPITREEVAFRLNADDKICGFYFHRVQKEYALLICQKHDTNKYSVYGLSSKDRRTLATSANFNLGSCEVATCGALFWRKSSSNHHNSLTVHTESILMFNLDSENFAVKDQPTDRYKREARTHVKLLEIDEKLGCCDVYQKLIHVWILEDVENWKWCKRYVVDLNRIINIYVDQDMPDAKICVVATQKGNMLLFRSNVGLLWYNLRLNKVSKINTGSLDMTRSGLFPVWECDVVSITSSLVSLRERNILPESPSRPAN